MSWRKAWKLSETAFTEIAVQAIYAFRQGNLPVTKDPREVVPRARRMVLRSKALISVVLGFISLGALVLLRSNLARVLPVTLPHGYFVGSLLTGILILQIAFLWWTGLQVLPTYLSSGVLNVLEQLPIEETTLDQVALLLFLRLFDTPALTCLILTPLAVGLGLGSIAAGIVMLLAELVAVTFALVLALQTGRFFLRRVQGARGGGGHTIIRWAYLVLWAVPAFAMYGFVVIAPSFLSILARLLANGPATTLGLLEVTFPLPFGLLVGYVADPAGPGWTGSAILLIVGAVILYAGLFGAAADWLLGAPRRLSQLPVSDIVEEVERNTRLRSGRIAWAVLRKDLRTASRTPGYAFLILLPLLDAVAIGLWTYVSNPPSANVFSLGVAAVTTAALLATFFGPAFFAIEVMGYSYTRALPLSDRGLLSGKILLVSLLYLTASGMVLGLTLLRVFDPGVFVVFILAEFPAILAAALLELGILFRRARKRGLPIVNLYAGAWWAVAVAIPGLVVAGSPLAVFQYLRIGSIDSALPVMALVALSELAVCVPFAYFAGENR